MVLFAEPGESRPDYHRVDTTDGIVYETEFEDKTHYDFEAKRIVALEDSVKVTTPKGRQLYIPKHQVARVVDRSNADDTE